MLGRDPAREPLDELELILFTRALELHVGQPKAQEIQSRLKVLAGSKWNADGSILVTARSHRRRMIRPGKPAHTTISGPPHGRSNIVTVAGRPRA